MPQTDADQQQRLALTTMRIVSEGRRHRLRQSAATLLAVASTLCAFPATAAAQYLTRPFVEWRTLDTPHFSFHYPREFEDWTRFVAARIEAVDSSVSSMVGYTPAHRVDIVVEDPYNVANGFAVPFLDRPVIMFWAVPPSPREEVGEFRTWGEILSTHEFAHIAHLSRPSRNPWIRRYWELLPVHFGPITLGAPRWVDEGYATYVEGRVTGTGRPYGTWRPTLLRQWAIEGQLPSYAEMNASSSFDGGSFAYLVGSAYLEWLARREGDSSLVHIWRRMTARQVRSFDVAFAGVYGDGPAALYGRFRAEVTGKALAVEQALENDSSAAGKGLVQGELVQHLSWGTGDPAVSGDGQRVALVLRSNIRPSRVVIWKTAPEPDTTLAKRDSALLKGDPEDVPARTFHPPPKKPLATLVARAGLPFEDPRFLSDGHRLLVWRNTPQPDGTLRPEVYVWNSATGDVRQVTHGGSVREPDPAPDGRSAAAVRCTGGHCDVVRVDLMTGAITTIAAGNAEISYDRPRFAPDGAALAVVVQHENRWRVARVDPTTGSMRPIDPDDGASRYDAAWLSPGALVVASDRGGIVNLERLSIDGPAPRTLTRVTGEAVAPAPNPHDHSIWFLSLHARGYDVRRLPTDTVAVALVTLDSALEPALPRRSPGVRGFAAAPIDASHAYGLGPRVTRWVPAPEGSADGAGALVAISNVDPAGKLAFGLVGSAGTDAAWRGGSLGIVWRGWRPESHVQLFAGRQTPSAVLGTAGAHDLDATIAGGALDESYTRTGDFVTQTYRAGVVAHSLVRGAGSTQQRELAYGRADLRFRQTGDEWQLSEAVLVRADAGATAGQDYRRAVIAGAVASGGRALWPVLLSATYGQLWGTAHPFDRFAVGGGRSPIVDEAVLPQRIDMPALPTGTLVGDRVATGRVSTAIFGLTPFYWSGRVYGAGAWGPRWNRVYGMEWSVIEPQTPVLGFPGARLTFGAARSLDEPFERQIRGWIVVQIQP